jgi:hypothetical protein
VIKRVDRVSVSHWILDSVDHDCIDQLFKQKYRKKKEKENEEAKDRREQREGHDGMYRERPITIAATTITSQQRKHG